MGPPPRTKSSHIHSEDKVVYSATEEQEHFHLQGEVNGEEALQQLIGYLYPGDQKGTDTFLQDMASEFSVLGFK